MRSMVSSRPPFPWKVKRPQEYPLDHILIAHTGETDYRPVLATDTLHPHQITTLERLMSPPGVRWNEYVGARAIRIVATASEVHFALWHVTNDIDRAGRSGVLLGHMITLPIPVFAIRFRNSLVALRDYVKLLYANPQQDENRTSEAFTEVSSYFSSGAFQGSDPPKSLLRLVKRITGKDPLPTPEPHDRVSMDMSFCDAYDSIRETLQNGKRCVIVGVYRDPQQWTVIEELTSEVVRSPGLGQNWSSGIATFSLSITDNSSCFALPEEILNADELSSDTDFVRLTI